MYEWLTGKNILLSPQLLFGLYYDFVCKSTCYCKNVRQIQIILTPITGTEVHQYMVPEYNIREEISP